MPTVTLDGGLVVLRDGLVGIDPACCCEGSGSGSGDGNCESCDCGDDYFYSSEYVFDCAYFKNSLLMVVAGGAAAQSVNEFLGANGVTKKESSPERDCMELAKVYVRASYQTNILDEACKGTQERRIYVPDCDSNTLVDITSDYDAPPGVFDLVIEDQPGVVPCHCPPDVPPLPPLPVCNPLP